MTSKLDPKEVELFLLDNLDFFESRESLIGEMKFKHSSSSASSLLERQINKLRDEQSNLIDLLSSFVNTAQLNEDLFKKSKELTLSILGASSRNQIKDIVQKSFTENFGVNNCKLDFYSNSDIDEIEDKTGMSFHKGSVHCGSFSKEKMEFLFKDKNVESVALAVLINSKEIGILMLGSYERTRYLGDEDTTFIEYIRDILEKKLESIDSLNA
ncbi:DUF484 family protein [Gammaproteobacteria bacterium]|jgi:uncharacterized protein YigA (DUF484 family)|nr:DUF484 family protein [Gammaproteobacteria bacterium]MDA9146170.1 DUF484 family protein [Gammaproteobacteria bacterium]MDA9173841.1 DUF484 family protein [Gammaproteobacteria bacterium]MDB4848941.1 DUF484 family protein [Gammaproteobacteria bacterium]MDC0402035.1 DUF484 family protein [Gammaproteobacteria bacterium]